MVKLNRIYTRTGDDGSTGLGDASRVTKDHVRVTAYGEVDEANACMGLAVRAAVASDAATAALLRSIQNDLFDVGADLCVPIKPGERAGEKLRVTAAQTGRLEQAIDQHNLALAPLTSFVLPGGGDLSCALHMARTVTRRAERACVRLLHAEPGATNAEAVKYLNRLSDLLFVLARVANDGGKGDVLWVPGASR